MVTAGYTTADIGTDHAYIPIYLVENRLIPNAIAMDINEGPLKRAAMHVKANGLSEQIALRLSDGFCALHPGEAKTAILAGMGGGLVMKILKDYREVTCSLEECILQPQSKIAGVRAFLLSEGFIFIQEDMILEDGKFYPIMKVKPPVQGIHIDECRSKAGLHIENWSEAELLYGKLLLRSKNKVLKKFLEKDITQKKEIIKELEIQKSCRAKKRIEQLQTELKLAEKGMGYYAL